MSRDGIVKIKENKRYALENSNFGFTAYYDVIEVSYSVQRLNSYVYGYKMLEYDPLLSFNKIGRDIRDIEDRYVNWRKKV